MTVEITLTSAGANTSTFDLYSNLDGFIAPFETGVSKASLLSGYTSALVPDYTSVIKIQSLNGCVDFINVTLENTTTTTTSTSSSTTTTTTTIAPACVEYEANTFSLVEEILSYTDCYGEFQTTFIGGSEPDTITFCASEGTVLHSTQIFVINNGVCSTTTTTTTTELM